MKARPFAIAWTGLRSRPSRPGCFSTPESCPPSYRYFQPLLPGFGWRVVNRNWQGPESMVSDAEIWAEVPGMLRKLAGKRFFSREDYAAWWRRIYADAPPETIERHLREVDSYRKAAAEHLGEEQRELVPFVYNQYSFARECVSIVWEVLGILAISSLHGNLLGIFDELPPEMRIILALSDNARFGKRAAQAELLPEWEAALETLGKERPGLEDLLQLAAWGSKHPQALEKIWSMIEKYAALSDVNAVMGFTRTRHQGRRAALVYLFAARPDLCPLLCDFDPQNPTEVFRRPEMGAQALFGCYHSVNHHYRAQMLNRLLADDGEGAQESLRGLEAHGIKSDGFIRDSARMLERFLKNPARI